MAPALARGLGILEVLAGVEEGLQLHQIADSLGIPRSAAHRLLAELSDAGYVRQDGALGNYVLSLKLVSLGLKHLAVNDLVGLSRPVLEQLASDTAELVRLAVIDLDDMVWVAAYQGKRSGLRYDPDSGSTVTLSCSATGFAWMAHVPEEIALQKILRQGIASREDSGPRAPQTIDEIRAELTKTRDQGFAIAIDTYSLGVGTVAAPIFVAGEVAGAISITGPTPRLTKERLTQLAPRLLQTTAEVTKILEAAEGRLQTVTRA
ncbi:IclR family transcriptional regulator [Streptomyces sp. GD-15H]|uniref:IclR family transcriptional regulator n=1 Tax=Streptomyces sp. GD-15H TaxID=3129112 RepID=UPI0032515C6F